MADDESADDAVSEPSADSPDDDLRRRFRAALENKHGTSGAKSRGHESGHGPAMRSNDKRQRTFRRKAGG